ncbi:MAG: hypothetical protein AB2392_14895 [Neobacillus sp.]
MVASLFLAEKEGIKEWMYLEEELRTLSGLQILVVVFELIQINEC